jgi:hypothetical protein
MKDHLGLQRVSVQNCLYMISIMLKQENEGPSRTNL